MRVSLRGGDADRVTSCCATVERKQNKVTSCSATCVSDRSHSGRSIFFSIMLRAICRLLFVEARCFYEHRGDERAKTNSHIGTHPIIMQGISEHTQFAPMLKECARQLREWVYKRDGNRFVAAVFCRAGEKRSVAFASFLAIAMLECGVFGGSGCQIFHLNQWYWRRHTCQGICHECRNIMDPDKRRRPDIAKVVRIFCSP